MPKQETPDSFLRMPAFTQRPQRFTLVGESEVDLNLMTSLVLQSVHGRTSVYLLSVKPLCVCAAAWPVIWSQWQVIIYLYNY